MAGTLTIQNLPILTERYFRRLKDSLVDENIYETGMTSAPYTTTPIRFLGITDPATSVKIYIDGTETTTLTSKSNGSFEFSVVTHKGPNQVAARISATGELIGDIIDLAQYSFNTFFQAYTEELNTIRADIDRLQQEKFIDDRTDWDGNSTLISSEALRDNFNQFVSGQKINSHTRDQYRDFLKAQFRAYFYGTTIRSMNEIGLTYLGAVPSFRFLKDTFFARMRSADPVTNPHGFKPRTKSGVGNFLTLEWDAFEIWMYRRWYRVEAGELLLDPDVKYWIYLDGTVTAGLNRLQLQFMEINIPAIDYPIRELVATSGLSTIIAQADLRIDDDGIKTGVPGTVYLQVDRIPLEIVTLTGSTFGDLTPYGEIIDGTGFISLGVQKTAAEIGAVSVIVRYRTEPRILARVETTDHIISCEFVGRPRLSTGADGTTNGQWLFESQSRANEFIVVFPNYYLLAATYQKDFDTLCAEIIPAHKLKMVGDNVIVPTEQFPFPLSAELGATTRMKLLRLLDLSAELGATTRSLGADMDEIPEMVGELGATSAEKTLYEMLCITAWLIAATQVSTSDRDTVRAAIRPDNGLIYALIDSRYLQKEISLGGGFAAETDRAGAAVTLDSGDIAFQSGLPSGTHCLSYFKTADGLYARIINDSGTIETELEDVAGANLPKATGRKGVAMVSTNKFCLAFAGTPSSDEELLYRLWSPSLWATAVNISNPGGTGTSTFGDTLVSETAVIGRIGFLCVWKGATAPQEYSLYYRTSVTSWELVYDRATAGRVVMQPDFVQDRVDSGKAYAVFVDQLDATNSEVRFIERDGTWGTSVLLSSTNLGANSPSLAIDEKGNIFVTYVEYDGSVKSVWMRCRKAGETTWDAAVRVADSLTSVLVTDTYPKSTHLAKKARPLSYGSIPILWGDKFGGGGTDQAVYYRRGVRGI